MNSNRAILVMRNFLRDLKIGTKISILIVLTLLLMGLVIGLGLRQVNIMRKEITTIVEEDIPLLKAISKFTFHRLEQSVHLARAIQFGKCMAEDKAAKDNFEIERNNFVRHGRAITQEIEKNRAFVEQMYEKHRTRKTRAALLRIDYELRGIDKEHADYQFTVGRIFNLLSQGKLEEAEPTIQKITEKSKEEDTHLEQGKPLRNFSLEVENFVKDSITKAKKSERVAITGMLLGSSFVFLLSLGVGILISRSIRKPLSRAVDMAHQLARGERKPKIEVSSKNGTGVLLTALQDMSEALGEANVELNKRNRKLESEIEQRTAAQKTLEERIKELNCLFGLSKLVERPEISLEQIFEETASLIRKAYQEPDKTCVRITFEGVQYKTDNFAKSESSQHAELKLRGEKAGDIEVYYLGEKAENDQSAFLKEERDLLDAVAKHLGSVAERTHTGEKLQLFRNLIDQSNDAIFVLEPEWGRFLDVNEKTCNSLGYTREELLDMAIKDIEAVIPDDSAWTEHAKEVREKGYMVLEGVHKRRDGTTFPVEINIKFIEQEKDSYMLAVARDITEHKQAEEALEKSENKYRTLLENIPQRVFLKDRDSVYVSCNENYAGDLKIKPEEIAGRTDYEFYPKELAEKYTADDKRIMESGKTEDIEEKYIQDGQEIIVHTVKTPVKDEQDNVVGVLGIFWDVTELKKAEERQAELFEKVESINKELKDFAYVVSHDLKAPLRGIRTLADWITSDYAEKLDEKGKEEINLLGSRVDRMHNLIDGVLEYSRVGREKEKQVQVNLNELVPGIIDAIAPPKNITIKIENELPVVECGQTRIMQVFQNLLSNAVKYMDKPKGKIKVGCVEENGFWKFSVADNGPGIEEKDFERIFQMFQTLVPRDEFESTGVGLTVVKKIVELYGGKIWVESKPGQGSTFFFTLPKQKMGVKNAKLETNIAR